MAIGKESSSSGGKFFRTIAKLDAPVYAAIVGLGVPAMGLLVSDVKWKWIFAALFFAAGHKFWDIELTELVVQMKDNREIDRDELSAQKKWIIVSFIAGIVLAIGVWLFGIISESAIWSRWVRWAAPSYTLAEGLMIIHTAWVGWRTWNLVDKIGYDLGTGSPRGSRTEHQG